MKQVASGGKGGDEVRDAAEARGWQQVCLAIRGEDEKELLLQNRHGGNGRWVTTVRIHGSPYEKKILEFMFKTVSFEKATTIHKGAALIRYL